MALLNNTEPEPQPSRPNWKWLLVAVVAAGAIGIANNWTEVSNFAHLPQIAHSLGIG